MALDEQERSFVGRLSGKIEHARNTSCRARGSSKKSAPARGPSSAPTHDARQRVVVKVSYVKMCTAQGVAKARAHLSYLERDGVARDGSKGELFNSKGVVDRAEFWERSQKDPHQFRIIISPEQGHKMDLERFAGNFVKHLERKTGHKLDWCAVTHYNTDHPHVHLLVRGRAMSRDTVRFPRELISNGMREYARDIATMELGERTRAQQVEVQRREVHQHGYTSIDRTLERVAHEDARVKLNEGILDRDAELRRNALERLKHLEQLELVQRVGKDQWQLAPDFKQRLMAHQHDMDVHKRLVEAKCNPLTVERCALEPDKKVSGKVIARGLADEVRGTEYMVLVQPSGQARYVELVREHERERARVGDVVTLHHGKQGALEVHTHGTLHEQVRARHATWLDAQPKASALPHAFGRELLEAQRARRQELEQGGVVKPGEQVAVDELGRRLARVEFDQWLKAEHTRRHEQQQRPLVLVRDVARFEGVVRAEPVRLHGSTFLVVEGGERDTLVPLSKEVWALREQRVEGRWHKDEETGRARLAVRALRVNEVER